MTEKQGSSRGNGERILLIEDSPTQAALTEDMLVEDGYAVQICETGEAGLEAVRTSRPDLVLLDLELPGVDGFQVCIAIRDNPATYDLPVIMLTSRSEVPSVIAGLKAGADDYVSKSDDTSALLARVRRLLDRTRDFARLSGREKIELMQAASGTLSHGVNNPLQVVSLSLEVLRGSAGDDPAIASALDGLKRSVTQCVKLVKAIEKVSSLAASAFTERRQLVDIEQALDEAERLAGSPGARDEG